MTLPDVIGLRLEEALEILHKFGFEAGNVRITNSPKNNADKFCIDSRVVRLEKTESNTVDILVCNMQCYPYLDKNG